MRFAPSRCKHVVVPHVKTFGDVDPRSLEQLKRCMEAGDAEFGVLCADHHPGYSQPIGGAVAYEGYVSPSGVGYDIGCVAAGTPVTTSDGYAVAIEDVRGGHRIACVDRGRTRPVSPHLGAIARGRKAVREVALANGRTIELTADHRVMTTRGWVEVKALRDTDAVLCQPYIGLPHEPCSIEPALLRVLGYVSADGHLSPDGKQVSIYTAVTEDAAAVTSDLRALGFPPGLHRRDRAPGRRRPEIVVRVNSTALHGQLAAFGSPVGRKRWRRRAMRWLLESPAWARALWLSAFASAEMTTPAVVDGRLPNLALKRADGDAAAFVVELLASLGFRTSLSASAQHWVVQILGGEDEQLRFLEQVGFCRAVHKRRAAAQAASVAWQRGALLLRRDAARLQKLSLRPAGIAHRTLVEGVASRFSVARVFGEGAWVPVEDTRDAGTTDVWDVVTGDPAESFVAAGVVVHNCGNKAVQTDLERGDLEQLGGVERVMREITRRISFGMGIPAQERADHPVLEKIHRAEFEPQRRLAKLAREQLGTVGSGNHFVNVFEDEAGRIWVGVHFGSRGFGHKTASGFLALARGLAFDERAKEGEMDSPPVLFPVDSELGQAYVSAMTLAGEYAYAGRDVVVGKVLAILGADAVHEVHNHHNFAFREQHFGRTYWVVRKGCTPARPGQEGFVGGSMGDESVIVEGVESDEAEDALFSTVHGAGRVMSRSQAAGKVRRLTVYECSHRDCDFAIPAREYAGETCPRHPGSRMRKIRAERQVRAGAVDWEAVQRRLREQGIVLVGGGADEAPEVYKRLPDVLAAHAGSIRVKHALRPLGVAMAGGDVVDPYKD